MDGDSQEELNLHEVYAPNVRRDIRRLPRLVLGALRLVREASPREFAYNFSLQIIAALGMAGQVVVGRELLQRVVRLEDGSHAGGIVGWIAAFTVLVAIVSFASTARLEQQRLMGELVARHAEGRIHEVSTNVELLAFDSPSFHNRLQRAALNAATRPSQMANGVLGVISALVTLVGIAAALAYVAPTFMLLMVVGYVPVWMTTVRASKVAYRFSLEQTERDRRRGYLGYVLTRKDEAAEIRAYGLAGYLRRRYADLYDERIKDVRAMVRRRTKLGLVGSLMSACLNGAALAVLVWFVNSGRLDVAEAGAAAGVMVLFSQRLAALAGSAGSLFESTLFVEDFAAFISAEPQLRTRSDGATPVAPFDKLEVVDVSFTYPSRELPALSHVSLSIERGEVVALVGENGSGKTTLAKILCGLYPPGEGVVLWDGTNMADFDTQKLNDFVAVVFQDFTQYLLSARENIEVGRHDHAGDVDRLNEAARRAAADEFISKLRDGYETQLGAEFWGGSDISVGQWQRVALACGFFRDAPFLILDEPSASLDPRSEADLFENIRSLYAGRTVVLISHRFSTVRSADRIVVLDRGEIVEQGTHAQLVSQNGVYSELYTLQAASFQDPPT